MSKQSSLALIVYLLLFAPITAQAEAGDLPPVPVVELEAVECPFTPPLGEIPTCLMATLPMNHQQVRADGSLPADARTIGVHLTLLSNLASNPDPDPFLFLSGGPGQAGSDSIGTLGSAVELRRNRGMILVDQRGTGLSEPALYCEQAAPAELDGNRFNDPDADPDRELVERFTDCHNHWVEQGVDLAMFDTRAAALDLRAIREALDLRHWNIQGTSYGSRLALDLLRVDPEGVRAVVLNSPVTMESMATAEYVELRPQVFQQLFTNCAADQFCADQYGDIEQKFQSLELHFQNKPVVLQFADAATGEMIRESVTWADVVEALSGHLAFSEPAMSVPRFIAELYDVAQGRLSLDDREVSAIFSAALNDVIAGLALGQHLSVKCREDYSVMDAPAIAAVADANPLYYPEGDSQHIYRLTCPIWEVGEVEDRFLTAVETEHPVLVMSGDADGLVPHAAAKRLADRLPNSQLIVFPGMGHDVHLTLLCGRSVVANFLDSPNEPVDQSCVADVAPRFD